MKTRVFNEWVAGIRAAIEETKGDSEMKKEPISWVEQKSLYMPSTFWLRSEDESRKAVIHADGYVLVYSTDKCDTTPRVRTPDLRGLIASLQSILVLAEEHFGEDWGKVR